MNDLTVAQWLLPSWESPRAFPGLAFKTFVPIKVLTVWSGTSLVWAEVPPPPHALHALCSVGVRGEGEALTHRPNFWQGACEGGRLIRFFFLPSSPELICNSVFAPELSNTEIRRGAELRANEWLPPPRPHILPECHTAHGRETHLSSPRCLCGCYSGTGSVWCGGTQVCIQPALNSDAPV